MTQYFVKKDGIKKRFDRVNGRHFIAVEIVLGRRLLSLILTIFAPTIILNLVGHLSNFFKEFFFEATISVNVTVMLVLTTMFISVSSNLPKTSYIKMIDVWLLSSLVKPFLDILLQTYIDNLRADENRDINHHGTSISVGDKEGRPLTSRSAWISFDEEGKDKNLVSLNEATQQKALKEFYKQQANNNSITY